MNPLSFPLTPENAVDLLSRLAPPETRVVRLLPGDVIEWVDGCYEVHSQASPFVRCVDDDVQRMRWEPIDLRGLEDASCQADEVIRLLDPHLRDYLLPRLCQETQGPFSGFAEWDVIWQLAVHTVPGERLDYWVDFRGAVPTLGRGRHADANYFVHVCGQALVEMLSGRAGPALFWQGGAARAYEKVFRVRDGGLEYPHPFYQILPEFFTSMMTQGLRGIVPVR